jgi:hypothetical protein
MESADAGTGAPGAPSPSAETAWSVPSGPGWKIRKSKERTHHYYKEAQALQLQREHKVDGLAAALRSPEAEELFADSWDFECVVKPNAPAPAQLQEYEYRELAVENRWKDKIRFRRVVLDVRVEPRDGDDDNDSFDIAPGCDCQQCQYHRRSLYNW